MTTTTTQQIAAVERELKYRRLVFARRVKDGRMAQEQADHEIACMTDILDRLKRTDESEAEAVFPTLF